MGETAPARRTFTAVLERCPASGLYAAHVPGLPGARSQADSLDQLMLNLREVIGLVLDDLEEHGQADDCDEFLGLVQVEIER